MGKQVTIVVVRHPEKDGDKITARGAMQAWAAALELGKRFKFDLALWSGLHRTLQALQITATALDLQLDIEVPTGVRHSLDFTATLKATVGDSAGFFAEVERMKKETGMDKLTLGAALKRSEYARRGCEVMIGDLVALAAIMEERGKTTALCVSHSPWLELAALDTGTTPYGVGESDAMVYTVEDGQIIASELIRAPLPGNPLF